MIYIDNRQCKVQVNEEVESVIEEVVQYTLSEEKVNLEYEISIIFVDNEEIREINMDTREIDKVTDVLSFPMLDYPNGQVFKDVYSKENLAPSDFNEGVLILGDMAISIERALEQSIEYGHSFKREVCYLVVHSVLHLLGYDHMEEKDKVKMREREEYILKNFDIKR